VISIEKVQKFSQWARACLCAYFALKKELRAEEQMNKHEANSVPVKKNRWVSRSIPIGVLWILTMASETLYL
jgi:hypothetical protein